MSIDLTPSAARVVGLDVRVTTAPGAGLVHAVGVTTDGEVPPAVGIDRDALKRWGFTGAAGQTLVLPGSDAAVVAVGLGAAATVSLAGLRDAAAVAARAAGREDRLATSLVSALPADPARAAAAVIEGAALGRYSYDPLRTEAETVVLTGLDLVVPAEVTAEVERGVARGLVLAKAAALSRDLSNAPAGHLSAPVFADLAGELGAATGLEVIVHDKAALQELGCGGLLGVNAGSVVEPRMIVIHHVPSSPASDRRLAFVGKGVMYDSGGISLKPSNAMHAAMKMDMTGAASVLAAMTVLHELDVPVRVSAYLACTDNMPSGSATKLGDVLTTRAGRTIEVVNTDAEGRLVMVDAISLAQEDGADAIIDIATLTGACLAALGPLTAGLISNDDTLAALVSGAADATDERVWRLPLDTRYRPWMDSEVADIKNLGGEFAGAITAALFLSEWVGETPWAHLDIAGPMRSEKDDAWRTRGATGFGARLLAETAVAWSSQG